MSRLQTALRRKEADCEAVETEISAQIADYQRLKQRLLQQVRRGNTCRTGGAEGTAVAPVVALVVIVDGCLAAAFGTPNAPAASLSATNHSLGLPEPQSSSGSVRLSRT